MTTRQTLERIARNANIPEMEIQELLREWENDHNAATTLRKYIEPGTSNLNLAVPFFPVYNEILVAAASQVIINIPSNANHLFFIGAGRTDHTGSTGELMLLQFNGDTASNYRHNGAGVLDNVASKYQNLDFTGIIVGNWATADADADTCGSFFCFIPHIKSQFWKSTIATRGLSANAANGMVAHIDYGMWESVSPIESMRLYGDGGGNIIAGSALTVLGMT